jgi:hypothetical protein
MVVGLWARDLGWFFSLLLTLSLSAFEIDIVYCNNKTINTTLSQQ